jgi:homoserine O-acetyltransferase
MMTWSSLVSQGLGRRDLRLVLGHSMGGMNAWIWGVKYPDFMDALVPMASQPSEMSGRNWMMRRLIIDSIRNDPDWNNGNYTTHNQPHAWRAASVYSDIANGGGTLHFQKMAPTREAADKLLNERLAAPFTDDTNDALYQWESSGDYNPSAGLERIQAAVLAINSADDGHYPPETGIMERELKRVKMRRPGGGIRDSGLNRNQGVGHSIGIRRIRGLQLWLWHLQLNDRPSDSFGSWPCENEI